MNTLSHRGLASVNSFSKNSRGFTLIELLVVIAIIGILSSVVLTSLNGARQKARDTRRIADIKQLQVAAELYFDANGQYPTALSQMVGSGGGASLSVLPKDPGDSTKNYYYAYRDVNSKITAYALGADLEGAADSTTLDDGDSDLTITETNGWVVEGTPTTIDGDDADNCVGAGTTVCYDVSNVNTVN